MIRNDMIYNCISDTLAIAYLPADGGSLRCLTLRLYRGD